jgi:hypothetical protein
MNNCFPICCAPCARPLLVRSLIAGLLLLVAPLSAQGTDPLFARVQQLVNGGNRDAARAAADSALQVRTPGTAQYAEALYARAFATSDAASAERDYLRVSVEYPFSPRAEDALAMIAQFRQARGDRAGARAQYERLAREFPRSAQAARANYWAGRLALDDGDLPSGCNFLFVASERVARDDVELRNQIEYLRRRCMLPGARTPTPRDSAPSSGTDTTATPPPLATAEFSVQVAAYQRKRDAETLFNRLKARGFPVRVVGTSAPYRVRVGRYATRADAVAAQGRMRRAKVNGIVVEAESR